VPLGIASLPLSSLKLEELETKKIPLQHSDFGGEITFTALIHAPKTKLLQDDEFNDLVNSLTSHSEYEGVQKPSSPESWKQSNPDSSNPYQRVVPLIGAQKPVQRTDPFGQPVPQQIIIESVIPSNVTAMNIKGYYPEPSPELPTCGTCGKGINSAYCEALGKTYHKEHFCCSNCNVSLAEQEFYQKNGKLFCDVCLKQISPRCHSCGKSITNKIITAQDKQFHPEHFICNLCFNSLEGWTFAEKKGKLYCTECLPHVS